jgi:hypothetical protein
MKLPVELGHPAVGNNPDDGERYNANGIYDADGNPIAIMSGLWSHSTLADIKKGAKKYPELEAALKQAELIVIRRNNESNSKGNER